MLRVAEKGPHKPTDNFPRADPISFILLSRPMIVKRSETIHIKVKDTYTWLLVTLPAPSSFFFTNEYLIHGSPLTYYEFRFSTRRLSLFRVFLSLFFTCYFVCDGPFNQPHRETNENRGEWIQKVGRKRSLQNSLRRVKNTANCLRKIC